MIVACRASGEVDFFIRGKAIFEMEFFYKLNALDEPRGPQAQNRNTGSSPRRLDCVVGWLATSHRGLARCAWRFEPTSLGQFRRHHEMRTQNWASFRVHRSV